MRGWRFAALLAAAAAAGCDAVNPFATAPPAAAPGVQDAGPRVAVCYNPLKTSADKVRSLAQADCFDNRVAERVDTDFRLDNCPLLAPGRATFVCRPK
ncbi:MAG: hypothetical protein JO032_00945 [Alphaproteobacteria bacterium]|nr:hypothetical protein [Alphaproteobacteria bacterium]MBV9551333.1 hypothetical protein [Alphaproteobacteria bacterium]